MNYFDPVKIKYLRIPLKTQLSFFCNLFDNVAG